MKTLFIGQKIVELPLIDSTNSYAMKLAGDTTVTDGMVIWTKNQTAGRGQRGNVWQGKADESLAMSVVVQPSFLQVSQQFYLAKIAALAVADIVTQCLKGSHSVKIKWPNDIYVNNDKLAGILIENVLKLNRFSASVIGIGINVNQVAFPPDLNRATSLKIISGKEFNLSDCMMKICESLEPYYLQLKAGKRTLIDEEYHRRLYRLNAPHEYKTRRGIIKARVIGVNAHGKLQLGTDAGELLEFDLKEVEFMA